jgi:hypothetical protein
MHSRARRGPADIRGGTFGAAPFFWAFLTGEP